MACPDDMAFAALADQTLQPGPLAALELHIDECESCRQLVAAALAVGTPAPRPGAAPDLAGSVIGERYEIGDVLGRGGMGTVYLARDKSLGRDVALKVHHAGSHEARLAREAQAMAKLAHPHVVTVFEVASVGDRMYVAMEYVRGLTFRGWLQRPRTSKEVIDVLLGVGQGLAAAHAAGLVHRDFKPENVLVGDDGRARVSDFGLAGTGGALDGRMLDDGAFAARMTETGDVLGTPAYMAPEQLAGERVDARSDQFAFCVVAWEALYGKRPFAGASPFSMLKAIEKRELPDGRGRLPRVRAVLERGLASDAKDRYAGMPELLAALRAAAAPRWTVPVAIAGASVAIALVGVGGFAFYARSANAGPVCVDGHYRLAPAWNEQTKAGITRSLTAAHLLSTAPILLRDLETYANEWATQYTDACAAMRVRGDQSAELLDRRMSCLDRNRLAFSALTEQLTHADGDVAERGISSVLQLPPNDICADSDALLSLAPPPKDLVSRQKLAVARAQLSSAEAMRLSGKYVPSMALATLVAEQARAIGYNPFLADAIYTVALIEDSTTKYIDEEKHLYEALHAAEAGGDTHMAAALWLTLVNTVGLHLERHEEAYRLLGLADAAVERAGKPLRLQAKMAQTRANLYVKDGEYEKARDTFALEATLAAEAYGPDDPSVANARNAEGTQYENLDNFPEAKKRYEDARDILVKSLGPEHPDVIYAYENIAVITGRMGEPAKGVIALQKALDLSNRVLGEQSERSAEITDEMSALSLEQEKNEDALKYSTRAIAIFEKVMGPEHSLTMDALGHKVLALKHLGKLDEAFTIQTRVVEITERARGPAHPKLAYKLQNLGSIELDRNHPRVAERLFRRAYAIFLKTYGPEHSLTKGAKESIDIAVSTK